MQVSRVGRSLSTQRVRKLIRPDIIRLTFLKVNTIISIGKNQQLQRNSMKSSDSRTNANTGYRTSAVRIATTYTFFPRSTRQMYGKLNTERLLVELRISNLVKTTFDLVF